MSGLAVHQIELEQPGEEPVLLAFGLQVMRVSRIRPLLVLNDIHKLIIVAPLPAQRLDNAIFEWRYYLLCAPFIGRPLWYKASF